MVEITLRERYNSVISESHRKFDILKELKKYDFVKYSIKEIYDEKAEEVLTCIKQEGFGVAEDQYTVLDSFIQLFYNDSKGNERMCYLLGVSEKGICVFDNDEFEVIYINPYNFNGILNLIEVIEEMETLNKQK